MTALRVLVLHPTLLAVEALEDTPHNVLCSFLALAVTYEECNLLEGKWWALASAHNNLALIVKVKAPAVDDLGYNSHGKTQVKVKGARAEKS